MGYLGLFSTILISIPCVFLAFQSEKNYKKWKQAENDYNNLLREVAKLTHENNILKNSNADTK